MFHIISLLFMLYYFTVLLLITDDQSDCTQHIQCSLFLSVEPHIFDHLLFCEHVKFQEVWIKDKLKMCILTDDSQ